MEVKEIMTRDVHVVRPDTTLQDAAIEMRKLDIGGIPVCDGDRLVGFLTDRDITVRATAEGLNPVDTPVSEVMTEDMVYCTEDQRVDDVADSMRRMQIRRIAVLDSDRRLIGIVSLADIALQSKDERVVSELVEGVSEPAH
jgi:CBS domain-containing protein